MNADFERAFLECHPHLAVVYDHFHLVKNLNEKVISEVRKDEQRRLADVGEKEAAKALKGSKYILETKAETRRERDRDARAGKVVSRGSELFNKPEATQRGGNRARYEELIAQNELLSTCDIVSLHAPATAETTGMMGDEAFALMKPDAILINTARGELVDNGALVRALETGRIAAAGLDTVAPEPVTAENPLLTAPEAVKAKILFSPHLGGITTATFYRCHGDMWRAAEVLEGGGEPANIVNR